MPILIRNQNFDIFFKKKFRTECGNGIPP